MYKEYFDIKISVIIPTYGDSWVFIQRAISSIEKQTIKPFEIIIVGGGLVDETVSNINKMFPDVKILMYKNNLGVAAGRNKGLRFADKRSRYYFLFDHDMYADRNMLKELIKVADIDKNVGIVTPKIYYSKDKNRIWSAGTGINLWTGQVLFRGGSDIGQYEKVEEVQVAPAAMLVKKEVIKEIGLFDERYFATYEDTDFCFRVRSGGYKIYYSPDAIAYHDLPISLKEESNRLLSRSYWLGRNRILFMKDYSNCFIIFLLFLPIYFIYYLFLCIKYSRLNDFIDFIKGTINGLFE